MLFLYTTVGIYWHHSPQEIKESHLSIHFLVLCRNMILRCNLAPEWKIHIKKLNINRSTFSKLASQTLWGKKMDITIQISCKLGLYRCQCWIYTFDHIWMCTADAETKHQLFTCSNNGQSYLYSLTSAPFFPLSDRFSLVLPTLHNITSEFAFKGIVCLTLNVFWGLFEYYIKGKRRERSNKIESDQNRQIQYFLWFISGSSFSKYWYCLLSIPWSFASVAC